MKKDLTKKVYVVSYASFSTEDNEVYTETVGVFNTLDEAKETLEKGYKSVRNEDFSFYEDDNSLNIKKTATAFAIDNESTYVSEKIEEKLIENTVFVSTYTDIDGCDKVDVFNTKEAAVADMEATYEETLESLRNDGGNGIVNNFITKNYWRIVTDDGTYQMEIIEHWAK